MHSLVKGEAVPKYLWPYETPSCLLHKLVESMGMGWKLACPKFKKRMDHNQQMSKVLMEHRIRYGDMPISLPSIMNFLDMPV